MSTKDKNKHWRKNRRRRFLVFLSHSSKDDWVARQLARQIEHARASCFLDVIELEGGDDFERRIKAALQECLELVVLITPAVLDSRYVWVELGAAWGQGKRIVPLLYGLTAAEIQANPNIPVFVKRATLRSLNEADEYLNELRARIEKKGKGRPKK